MFKNVAAKFIVFAFDTTTNAPKTGDSANITAYVSKDYGTVTVLGDTSATEMDATNAPGYYLFDAAQGETNADCLMVSGKSSTSNIKVIGAPAVIYTRPTTGWLAPSTAGRTLTVDASGRALADIDTIKTNPVVNGGTITFPTTATLASTSNITAAAGCACSSIGNNAITAASIAADAITAAKIADGAIDTATFAGGTTIPRCTLVDTTTTNTDMISQANVRSAVGLGGANLDTQLDALPTNSELTTAINTGRTTAMTESYAADTVAPTLEQILFMIWAILSERSIATTTLTSKKLDGSTTAMTHTLNDATTPTSQTRTT